MKFLKQHYILAFCLFVSSALADTYKERGVDGVTTYSNVKKGSADSREVVQDAAVILKNTPLVVDQKTEESRRLRKLEEEKALTLRPLLIERAAMEKDLEKAQDILSLEEENVNVTVVNGRTFRNLAAYEEKLIPLRKEVESYYSRIRALDEKINLIRGVK